MRHDFHLARSRGKCHQLFFSHLCRRGWLSRQPDPVQTRFADRCKKLRQGTLLKRKRPWRAPCPQCYSVAGGGGDGAQPGVVFLWRIQGGEKSGGYGENEEAQKKKNTEK